MATDALDLVYSSNVLEHVPDPEAMADEMVRAARPGGTVVISWTPWLSPWGGHETAPWHYLGGRRAADRYARRLGRRPKNDYGRSLYACSVGRMMRWLDGACATVGSRWSRCCRATTRRGPGGSSGCPASERSSAGTPSSWCGSGDAMSTLTETTPRAPERPTAASAPPAGYPAALSQGGRGAPPRLAPAPPGRRRRVGRDLLPAVTGTRRARHEARPHRRGGFLLRALHLWDPQGALGQLQNQAYGYLFPVGPFHLALTAAGLPEWVVQRLWWTTILVVAFLGIWRLSRAMGLSQPWVRLIVAVVYALGPRMLSEVAVTSVEVWPLALAPWVLLPLVVPGRTVRWRATRSGLALACVGGVNAVATGAVLVLPLIWLLTRRWDLQLVRLGLAWGAAVVVASAWWVLPLLVLGRNSPPFLSWIENAAVTTATASPFEALRGTSAWLGFLATPAGPSWPAAWLLLTSPLLIVATTTIAALGLAGLALRSTPHRPFLLLALVIGLGLVTLGNPVSGWFADVGRHLLDGPLAPLRNTHKFELVVRLPLVIGLGHLLARAHAMLRRVACPPGLAATGAARRRRHVAARRGLRAPAVGVALARPEGYRAIPDHWRQAAAWLDAQPAPGAVLVPPRPASAT